MTNVSGKLIDFGLGMAFASTVYGFGGLLASDYATTGTVVGLALAAVAQLYTNRKQRFRSEGETALD